MRTNPRPPPAVPSVSARDTTFSNSFGGMFSISLASMFAKRTSCRPYCRRTSASAMSP